MELYALSAAFGFVLCYIYLGSRPSGLEKNLTAQILMGKKVVISIGEEATILELVNNKIVVTKGTADFYKEKEDDGLGDIQPDKLDSDL